MKYFISHVKVFFFKFYLTLPETTFTFYLIIYFLILNAFLMLINQSFMQYRVSLTEMIGSKRKKN